MKNLFKLLVVFILPVFLVIGCDDDDDNNGGDDDDNNGGGTGALTGKVFYDGAIKGGTVTVALFHHKPADVAPTGTFVKETDEFPVEFEITDIPSGNYYAIAFYNIEPVGMTPGLEDPLNDYVPITITGGETTIHDFTLVLEGDDDDDDVTDDDDDNNDDDDDITDDDDVTDDDDNNDVTGDTIVSLIINYGGDKEGDKIVLALFSTWPPSGMPSAFGETRDTNFSVSFDWKVKVDGEYFVSVYLDVDPSDGLSATDKDPQGASAEAVKIETGKTVGVTIDLIDP